MSLGPAIVISDNEKHNYDVTALLFKNNKLYSASDDGKIKIWSPDLKLEKEIQAHSCSVYSLTADREGKIISCSNDGSVRIWKPDLEEHECFIQPGEQEIWKVYWADDILSVVDDRGIVTLFNQNKSINSLVIMMEQIKDIAFKNNFLYTVRDLDLVVTEILEGTKNRYTCRSTLSGRAPLHLLEDKLIYSTRDARGFVVNNSRSNFNEIAKLETAHELVINTLCAGHHGDECRIFTAGWDKMIKQWKLDAGKISPAGICDVEGYINVVCVDDSCSKVFAGGADGKIWSANIK